MSINVLCHKSHHRNVIPNIVEWNIENKRNATIHGPINRTYIQYYDKKKDNCSLDNKWYISNNFTGFEKQLGPSMNEFSYSGSDLQIHHLE